jgi:S-adenosylmethionine hydrolase
MTRPLIALLTDFGTRDHYVASMKGVILGICRSATLVDITHEIDPQDVHGAALELAACYAAFPRDTIFVVVVDPGVGSERRAIALRTTSHLFVGPDNGVLSTVADMDPPQEAVVLQAPEYARPAISRTFEGRDRFAPAAAWLATGVPLVALGPPAGPLHRPRWPTPHPIVGGVIGEVVRVDRFGNLITNLDRASIPGWGVEELVVRVDGTPVERVAATYADLPAGAAGALFSSSGHLEIAVNGGSAAERLEAGRGARVEVLARPRLPPNPA